MNPPNASIAETACSIRTLYDRSIEHATNINQRKKIAEHTYQNFQLSKQATEEKVRHLLDWADQQNELILKWSQVRYASSDKSKEKIISANKPKSLEDCLQYARNSLEQMSELGEPSRYASSWSIGSGNGIETFFIIAITGVSASIGSALLSLVVAFFFVLVNTDASFESVYWSTFFVIFVLMVFNGISESNIFQIRPRDDSKIMQGYSKYLIFSQAKSELSYWHKQFIDQLDITFQEKMGSANEPVKSTHPNDEDTRPSFFNPATIYQKCVEQIELDDKRGKEQLEIELAELLKEVSACAGMSKWSDPRWLANPSRILTPTRKENWQSPGIVRIGELHFPKEEIAPFLLDLGKCGHIFIKTTDDHEQGSRLLKSIVARLVFTNPLLSTKFIFIDTKTVSFSLYQNLPDQMGNYDYSDPDEILEQMKALEFHKKRIQGKIGVEELGTYNRNAAAPEMYHILCISGFPNPDRFTTEARVYLENIIESGPRAGIHVIAQIQWPKYEASRYDPPLNKALQSGAILTPSETNWQCSFGKETIAFSPDETPGMQIFENILPQIKTMVAKTSQMVEYSETDSLAPLKVFLCHSSGDKELARELYRKLHIESWMRPWLDEEKLLPGQNWDLEIKEAVAKSDVVIVILSNNSVNKEGYVQKELHIALDIAQEKPEGTIFIIPLRIEDCMAPSRLRTLQRLDYFPFEQREKEYHRLLQSLRTRYETLQSK